MSPIIGFAKDLKGHPAFGSDEFIPLCMAGRDNEGTACQ
jgi:hypothetical protein